ncbi:MAG: DUF5684 domain-containing protein [Myxococcota bacterium]
MAQMDEMQARAEQAQGMGMVGMAIYAVVMVFFAYCGWKLFVKAGKPGWAVLVPIYNMIVLLQIVGRPIWWIVLMLIPLVNFVILIILNFDIAKAFGKGGGFAIGLLLLGFIFFPILALGSAVYQAPAAKAAA